MKPLSERMRDQTHGANHHQKDEWADEVSELESSLADANKALKLVEDHGLLAIVNELEAALAEARRENEKLQELKNFCYAEAQTQGDGRDFSLAAYMLRDLPTTKRAELTELCQAMSNETASKSDWEGLKQWWLEAALKSGDDDEILQSPG